MGLLLDLAIAAPVVGAAVGVVAPERAVEALRVSALLAAGLWFALLVDASQVSVGHLHSAPLVAAAGCGAALLLATVDRATLARPAWAGVALAAVSVALAGGHSATDGGGAVAGLAVAVVAASVSVRPTVRVEGPAAVGLVLAAAGLVLAAAGLVALRSAANSWQLPLADAVGSHRGAGLSIVAGAALLMLAGSQRRRSPSAVLVPSGAFLAAQAAPILHRADGAAPAAIVLAAAAAALALAELSERRLLHVPTAALTLLALAALVGPGSARGPGLLLAAAGTLVCAIEWPAAAALGVPGGVALALALTARGGAVAFVVGVFAGLAALGLAAVGRREGRVARPGIWSMPVLVLGAWLLVAPGTWGWVGPVGLRSYDLGAARALAGAALCIVTLVLLGREPGGWYARVFPPDSPGEDVVRH